MSHQLDPVLSDLNTILVYLNQQTDAGDDVLLAALRPLIRFNTEAGHHVAAERLLRRVITIQEENGTAPVEIDGSRLQLVECLNHLGRYAEIEELLDVALMHAELRSGIASAQVIEIQLRRFANAQRMGNLSVAEARLRLAIHTALESAQSEERDIKLYNMRNALIEVLQDQERYSEAAAEAQSNYLWAESIWGSTAARDGLLLGLLVKLQTVLKRAGDDQKAAHYAHLYHQALRRIDG
jgi:hypothetical protein